MTLIIGVSFTIDDSNYQPFNQLNHEGKQSCTIPDTLIYHYIAPTVSQPVFHNIDNVLYNTAAQATVIDGTRYYDEIPPLNAGYLKADDEYASLKH